MEIFVAAYLALGFVVSLALVGWIVTAEAHRHGGRGAVQRGKHATVEMLVESRRAWVASWTFVVAAPLIAAWATMAGEFDAAGAITLGVLWLAYVWFLRWLYRARSTR